MQETELKFQVPAPCREALQRAVATRSAQTTRLRAVYADTADHRLAAAGLALRLRQEGRVWVQTLKGRGDGLMQRLEHEVVLPPQRGLPSIDPARHDASPAGLALRAALAAADGVGPAAALLPVYRTDIQRLHRLVRYEGAVVEIAYDRGHILAGTGTGTGPSQKAWVVDEIEFELKRGPPQALTSLAACWVARHGLWWDVRTKSERGYRLALGLAEVPATQAARAQLPEGGSLQPAFAVMLQSALGQALPNLAELAGAAAANTPRAAEHLHQLRVALRRLRTVLLLLADWCPEPATALALEAQWQAVFSSLGAARDADVLAATWLPRLAQAGAPPLQAPVESEASDLGALLRAPALSVLLLQTLSLALPVQALKASEPVRPPVPSAAASEAPCQPPERHAAARQVLRHAWRRAWADAAAFAQAPLPQQHRARKRLKRLRYALEFLSPLFPKKSTRRLLLALNAALKALGDFNDLQAAHAHFSHLAAIDPAAWFAVGWLAAQAEPAQRRATQALAGLKKAPKVWQRS